MRLRLDRLPGVSHLSPKQYAAIVGTFCRWVGLGAVSGLFPIKHFSHAMLVIFNPFLGGSGWRPRDLIVIAAWGVFGMLVALRKFSWEPRV